jgi:hypothetical protein
MERFITMSARPRHLTLSFRLRIGLSSGLLCSDYNFSKAYITHLSSMSRPCRVKSVAYYRSFRNRSFVLPFFPFFWTLMFASCVGYHIWYFFFTWGAAVAQSECLTTGWTIGVRSPTGGEDFSSSPCVQTGSGVHPASYPMGTGSPFPGGKAWPGAWRWPLTPI